MQNTFAERLDAAMRAGGTSQERLERTAHLTRGSVSGHLTGVRPKPPPDELRRMAEALGVDTAWLATGEGIGPVSTEAPEGLGRKAVQVDMPDGFFERLVEAVEADPRPITNIERDARVSNAWLSRLVRQTKAASLSAAEPAERPMLSLPHTVSVARTLSVRIEWLIEGTGPMRVGEEPAAPAAVARVDDPRLDALLAKVDEKRGAFDRARYELAGACDAVLAYLKGGEK